MVSRAWSPPRLDFGQGQPRRGVWESDKEGFGAVDAGLLSLGVKDRRRLVLGARAVPARGPQNPGQHKDTERGARRQGHRAWEEKAPNRRI